MKTVFVDSSVLFSAVNSLTGGSSKLFTIKKIRLMTSRVILAEVERNTRKKLQPHHLARFFMLVQKIKILDSLPDDQLIAKTKAIIAIKDAVILAEAKKAKADFLVTLDKTHFLTSAVDKFLKPQKALTPKMPLELIKA